ncbi:META domain-containing protein [Achromobacter sp. GG226]|uniref:META domain-containing protein n=1 Tax=Verticiella alkaliphila TaxID=2779529 RepID=UPI001C0D022B|nr:META domain-containing protein [Verticiella sp. GG226]MBU4609008.1 META domain-containing protein [Verticiella sp. GG226]
MQCRAIFASVLAAGLVGCALQPPAQAPGLDGTRWQLVSVSGRTLAVPQSPPVELRFLESRVNVHGCNALSGRYVQEGTRLTVPKGFVGTRMACEEGLLAVDNAATRLFEKGVEFRKEGDTLVIRGQGERWTFRRHGSMPSSFRIEQAG